MDKLNIGFIGGCLNNQDGIYRDDLYYSVTSKFLTRFQADYQISLGSYLSFDQLFNQTFKFIDKKQPNLIYIFIRPQPLLPLQKPIIKYCSADKKISYALHPGIFSRDLKWNNEFTVNEHSNSLPLVRKSILNFREINLLAGVVLGLHHWALEYLTHQLELVKDLCNKRKIKLKIISPPQNHESVIANFTCKRTAYYLAKFCKTANLDFININSFSLAHFEQDKIHFNIDGHKKLGELIYNDITLKKQKLSS